MPVGSSAAWKWVHSPASATPGRAATSRAAATRLVAGEPAPTEPGLDLELDAERPGRVAAPAAAASGLGQRAGSPTATAMPEPGRLARPSAGGTGYSTRIGPRDAAVAQLERLVEGRHAEPVGAGRLEGRATGTAPWP